MQKLPKFRWDGVVLNPLMNGTLDEQTDVDDIIYATDAIIKGSEVTRTEFLLAYMIMQNNDTNTLLSQTWDELERLKKGLASDPKRL